MKNKILLLTVFALTSSVAYAAPEPITADSVLLMIQGSMAPAVNKLTAQAITWLAIFSALQFVITNLGLIKSGADIEAVIAKGAGSVLWMGVCVYIINNGPQWIGSVGSQMFDLLGVSLPSPGGIIGSTIALVSTLGAIAVTVGVASTTAGMLLVYVLLFILAVGMFFAFKIFMVQLEVGLVVMLSPLSFSFLGLNALKDQGIAPFKALISLSYRILLMTLILSAFTEVNSVATESIKGMTATTFMKGAGEACMIILSAVGAYIMLAYVFYKSDSIAASLAGGQTGQGPADVASAAAAGAAAGAAIASGGAAVAGAAAKTPQSVGNVMSEMLDKGAVSNASPRGAGGQDPMADAPRRPPAPPPSFPVNSRGAPRKVADAQGGATESSVRPSSIPSNDVAPKRSAEGGNSDSPSAERLVTGNSTGSETQAGASMMPSNQGDGAATKSGIASKTDAGTTLSKPVPPADSGIGQSPKPESGTKPLHQGRVRPTQADHSRPPVRPGSGADAGISGASPGQSLPAGLPPKKGVWEKIGEANKHLAQEKAATHVTINTHHSD